MARPDKQAVVLIHGIGEQEPMETLRRFVDAMWTTDDSLRDDDSGAEIWSKPDVASGNLELRKITTRRNRKGVRTDFYELYWAHLMTGTRLSHVLSWVWLLLFRRPGTVPEALRSAWLVLWAIAIVAAAVAANQALPDRWQPLAIPAGLAAIGALILGYMHYKYLVPYVGDAARYLSPAPANVMQRKDIREAGIELLRKLINSGDYARIIVVGHSLGTIIGYDMLRHLWPEYNTRLGRGAPERTEALEALEAAARAKPFDLDSYRKAQRAYLDELRDNGNPWNVTDFVTFGSPLAHADALMAHDPDEFASKRAEREFPSAPPEFERIGDADRFAYERGYLDAGRKKVKRWIPHHGAVFAPVRWTNLYFPSSRVVFGDIIGGPVGRVFGKGIRDIPVTTAIRHGIFNHTDYFTFEPDGTPARPGDHVAALREALNLADD